MKKTEVSTDDNILIIEFGEDPTPEAAIVVEEIKDKLKSFGLPWYCIADYTGIKEAVTPTLLKALTDAMELLGRYGVSEVVRVTSKDQIMFQITLSKQSKHYGGYEGIPSSSIEGAKEIIRKLRLSSDEEEWETK